MAPNATIPNPTNVPEVSITLIDAGANPVTVTATRHGVRVQNSGKVKGTASNATTSGPSLRLTGLGSSSKKTIPYYNVTCVEIGRRGPVPKLKLEYVTNPEKNNFKIEEESLAITAAEHEANLVELRDAIHHQAYPQGVKFGKKAYVLVNPKSGPGNGVSKWEKEARPLFDAARMTYDVVILKKGGEATDLVHNLDIKDYDTIVAVSGDGTPHEIFNGLARRPDASKALRECPISHIPAGSGNALALNLYGSNKPEAAALAIVKGHITEIDLVSITQGDKRYLSFLSQALGIIAESDLGTEHLRWMGATRFEVGLAMRVFQKKCYPCDLAVKVVQDDKQAIKGHYRLRVNKPQATSQTIYDAAEDKDGENGLPPLRYGTVNSDLPEGWDLVPYENIGNFYCGNVSRMPARTQDEADQL